MNRKKYKDPLKLGHLGLVDLVLAGLVFSYTWALLPEEPALDKLLSLRYLGAATLFSGVLIWWTHRSRKSDGDSPSGASLENDDRLNAYISIFDQYACTNPTGMFLRVPDGRIQMANDPFLKLIKKSSEDVVGKFTHEIFDPPVAEQYLAEDREIIASRGPLVIDRQFDLVDKQQLIKVMKLPVFLGKETIAILGMAYDHSKDLLRDYEYQRLYAAIEQSSNIIVICNREGQIEFVNKAFEKATGYHLEEVVGRNPNLLKSGIQDAAFYQRLWHDLNSGISWTGEFCNRKKNGELYWESAVITPIRDDAGAITHFIATKQDITKGKEQELELLKLRKAVEHIDVMFVIADAMGCIQYVNPAYERHTGFTLPEVCGRQLRIIKEEGGKPFKKAMKEQLLKGKEWHYECVFQRKDKSIYWENNRVTPVFDGLGQLQSMIVLKTDISEKRRQEDKVLSLMRFREAVIDNAGIWIALTDAHGAMKIWNRAAERITGYTLEALSRRQKPWQACIPDETACDAFLYKMNRMIEYSEGDEDDVVEIVDMEGNLHQIQWSAKPLDIEEDDQRYILFIGSDVTHHIEVESRLNQLYHQQEKQVYDRTKELEGNIELLKQTQEKLIQQEKLAALGDLVSSVAHEINTPLGIGVTLSTFVFQQVDELKRALKGPNPCEDALETVEAISEAAHVMTSNLQRAGEMVSHFKQLAVDQQNYELRVFTLKDYIWEIISTLRPKLKAGHHEVVLDCDDITLLSYPGAYSQILTNLIVNSIVHGFEGKTDGRIHISAKQYDDKIEIRYKDNGKGIAAADLKKIYEPFFTTKKNKGSTGLGMHIVFNIVTHTLKGDIHCTSEKRKGLSVRLLLPKVIHEE